MPGIEWTSSLDHSGFLDGLREIQKSVAETNAKIEAAGGNIESMFKRIAGLAGVSLSLEGVKGFVGKVIEMRSYFQDIESSMKVFLGNEKKATEFTNKLKDYAYYNMFEFSELANASKQMIAYGHDVESIIPRLDQLSNVARGTSAPLMEMVGAYNRAKNLGGVGARDMQSWAAKGLVLNDILKEMGETVKGNSISFEQLNKVLDHVTGEGGMFHNLMGEQMDNISAEQGQLADTLDAMYNEIGEKYQDTIVKWYKMGSEIAGNFVENTSAIFDAGANAADYLMDHYKQIGEIIIRLIAVYGEWRATLIAANAVTYAKQEFVKNEEVKLLNEAIEKEKQGYEELFAVKEKAKNADLAEAVAKGDLTKKQAELIAAKRAELEQVQIDKESLDVDEKINDLKKRKLDIDLQQKVETQKLTLAQAQEVQQRREVLVSLEEEVRKRKEAKLAAIEQAIAENETSIKGKRQHIANNISAVEAYEPKMDEIDKQISKLELVGGKEAEINELKKQRQEYINQEISLQEENVRLEEEIEKLNKENVELGKQSSEVRLQYGSKEERMSELNAEKFLLEQQLTTQKGIAEESRKKLDSMVEERTNAQQRLNDLQQELSRQQEINKARVESWQMPTDTTALQEEINDQQTLVDTLTDATHMKEEETLATKAQEAAVKAQTLQTQLESVAEQQSTLATGGNATAKGGLTTATAGAIAATEGLTVAEKIHLIAMSSSSTATKVYTIAVLQAKKALEGVKMAMMTNPFGIAIGAITLALPYLFQWISGTNDAADKQAELTNSAMEASAEVDGLVATLQSAGEESKAHKDAVDKLKSMYEEYGIKLDETVMKGDDEAAKTQELIEKHDLLAGVLRQEAIEREKLNSIKEAEEESDSEGKKSTNKFVKGLSDDYTDSDKTMLATVIQNDTEALEKVKNAYRDYLEIVKRGNKGEAIRAWNAYNEAVKDASGVVVRFSENLVDEEGKQRINSRAKTAATTIAQQYIRELTTQQYELDKTKEATEASANAAKQVTGAQAELITRLRLGKATLSEIRDEINRIAQQNNINIDVNVHYNEFNKPAVLQGKNSAQLQRLAASMTAKAESMGKNGKVHYIDWNGSGKGKTFTREELVREASMVQNEASSLKAREDAANARVKENTKPKKSGGRDHTSEDKARERQRLFKQQMEEEMRLAEEEQKMKDAIEDARIAKIQDNNEREREERREQHERSMREIQEQTDKFKQEAYKRAEEEFNIKNKDKKKVFSDTEEGKAGWQAQQLDANQQAIIDAQLEQENAEYQRFIEERYKRERQASLDFLKEYGDYEQKKYAITQEYEQKISEASTAAEKASLEMQMDKEMKALDTERLQKKIDWSGVFSDLGGHTEEYLVGLRDQLQEILSTGDLPIDQMETIQGKINEINDEINKQGGIFKHQSDLQREHTRRIKEAQQAEERLNAAREEEMSAADKVDEITKSIRERLGEIAPELQDIDLDEGWLEGLGLKKESDLYKELSKLAQEHLVAEGKLAESREKSKNKLWEWRKAEDAANEKFADSMARYLDNINSWVQTYLGDLPGLLNELGLGGAGEKVSQGLSAVNNAAGAAADLANHNYVGAALKAVSAVKDFGRVLGIGGGNAAEINKQLEKLSDRNEILTKSIDRLTDAMSNKGGVGAIRQYEKLAELQKELEANLLKQMQLQMSYHEAHGSFNSYWGGFTQEEIDQFNRRNGTEWSGDLNDLTADIAAMLEADADLWQKIKDTGKGGYGGRVADWISQLAEQAGKAKEQTDALYASLTGGTSRDSVFDDFLNSLYDLADGSEDVMDNIAKNWQSMVNKMVINNLIGENMREELSDWYTELAELNRQRTDGLIDDDEYLEQLEELKARYSEFVEGGKQQIEQFTEMGIIQPIKDAANEVESIFGNLHDTILDDLTDLEMTGEAFARKLNEAITKQLIDKLIFNEEFNKWLEDWENRYNDAVSGETPDEAAIDQLLAEMTEKFDEAAEKAQVLRDRLKEIEESVEDTTFKDMGDAWLNTLMDMSKTAEDWSEEIGRTMAQKILSEVVSTQYLQPLLDRLQDEFNKSIKSMNGDVSNIGWIVNNGEIASIIEEMKAQFPEMQQLVKNIFDAFGVGLEDTREGFSNLPSFLVSALTDMEGDAETLGADIAKSLMEQMLNTIVSRKYAEWMEGINERWKAILAGESNETWEDIQKAVEELYSAIGDDEDVTKLVDGLKGLQKESDTTFKGMADTFMSALMDMEADAESFGKEIGNVLAQKIIEEMIVGKQLQPFLDNIQKAFDDAMSVDGATPDSIIEAMKPAIDDATSAFEDMQPVVKSIMESLGLLSESFSSPFDNMRDSMLSALMDMENGVENFAKNLNNIITQSLIDKFVLGDAFNDRLEEWKAQYAAIMGDTDMDEETRARQLKQLQSVIQGYSEQMKGEAQAIHDLMGTGQYAADQQATMNMSDKATYEQMDQYLGTQMGIYIATEQGNLVRQQILQTLQAMSGITSPNNDAVSEINGKLNFTNEYLLAIRNSNSAILSLLTSRLNSIDSRLNKFI